MGGSCRNPVKVVIINTQYVETDPMSFKSVVQRLTGKDAIVQAKPPPILAAADSGRQITGGNVGSAGHSVMSRGVSFKDLDKFIMDIPSLDELYRMCMD